MGHIVNRKRDSSSGEILFVILLIFKRSYRRNWLRIWY